MNQRSSPVGIIARMQIVAIPPLANTCRISRGPALSTALSERNLISLFNRESALELIKKNSSGIVAGQPPKPNTIVPTITVPIVPLYESALTIYETKARITASPAPISSCKIFKSVT
jgi:hypothetical protein